MQDPVSIPIRTGPSCPPDVPAEVAAEFNRVVQHLGRRAESADAYTILMFATAWTTWRKAQADVAEQGAVVMSGGTPCPHPALAVAHQAHGQLLALAKELGLTAASRKKLAPPEYDDDE